MSASHWVSASQGVSASLGVSASGGCLLPRRWGCLLPGGYFCFLGGVYFPGGVCFWGCLLPRGCLLRGCIPACTGADNPPCGQNDRQVLKHNLSANSFADGNYEDFSLLPNRHVLFQTHFFCMTIYGLM